MKTERDFGFGFAEDQGDGPVKIDEMITSSLDIPPDDYLAMLNAGIQNPDAREYWKGYNAYFSV